MTKFSTKCAGIDTGKAYLDIAIHAASDSLRVTTTALDTISSPPG